MATAEKHSPDLVVPPESIESQGTLVAPAEEKSAASENQKEKIPLIRDEEKASTSGPCNAICIDLPGDKTDQMRFVDGRAHHSGVYQPNIYAPQVQTIYYGGYENPPIEWDEYPQFLNQEGMETGSHGASLMFHTGYGYSPQMPYGPYSPVTTPLSSSSRDNQMYSTQQFTFAGPYFQQPGPVTMPYLNSSAPVSQGDLTIPVGAEQQGFGGFGSGGLWSDWSKSPDGQRPLTPFSPAASPPPSGGFGTFGNSLSPFSSGMDSQQQRACGFGSSTLSYDRGYSYSSMYHQGANFGANLGTNARGWVAIDKGSWRGKASTAFCSCNGSLDLLSEQNRGPRATRPKNLATDANPTTDGKTIMSAGVVAYECNKPDFVTEYKDAKFFIIKSYSEDNVHKSIKYGVWASTPNGNKKLDLAYREAKEKEVECPVFLFFSVNASGQFCGVAEMIGPVDFERSVDYWQQDKWSGQFPVKWHIVKDAPNSLFRHIILENNGNKPVTNSRDTQEVKLEEGFKMLNIFKNHEADMSILDDFDFYEERQRAMQERKVWQQQQQQQQQRQPNSVVPTSAVLRNELHNPAHLPEDLANQMPKTFAQAVRLDDKNIRGDPEVAGKGSLTTSAAKAGDLGELAATGIQSS